MYIDEQYQNMAIFYEGTIVVVSVG
jgi:hypothetical protein